MRDMWKETVSLWEVLPVKEISVVRGYSCFRRKISHGCAERVEVQYLPVSDACELEEIQDVEFGYTNSVDLAVKMMSQPRRGKASS